jgi:hypothetical protein
VHFDEEIDDRVRVAGVEIPGGLVGEKYCGLMDYRARYRRALLLFS